MQQLASDGVVINFERALIETLLDLSDELDVEGFAPNFIDGRGKLLPAHRLTQTNFCSGLERSRRAFLGHWIRGRTRRRTSSARHDSRNQFVGFDIHNF